MDYTKGYPRLRLIATYGVLLLFCLIRGGAQTSQERHSAFEVASFKLDSMDDTRLTMISPPSGGRFNATHIPLSILLTTGFGLRNYQIIGEPRWADTTYYDLVAQAPAGTNISSYEDLEPMIQDLLTERLGLKTHFETRRVKGYELRIGKGGPHLTPSSNIKPYTQIDNEGVKAKGITVKTFASALSVLREIEVPVKDVTGISGLYDVDLRFSAFGNAATEPGISLFTALRDQMGLELVPLPVETKVLIIDKVNRVPIAN